MPNRRLLSQINVTPLVDVVLVLLIIFMITAPMMQEGIDVNLPRVEASAITTQEEPLVVTITRNGKVLLNDREIKASELEGKLRAIFKVKRERMVLLRADREVPYGYVVRTMADIRRAGIEKIGMVTEPVWEKK